MAYQVLARKYRPQRFADVVGQDHVTVTLMNALTQQRIAHGYIFSGHRGIGKTTIARILAMALNCRNTIGSPQRPTAEPCEICESCTEIKAGNAVDVIEIDAATNRGIDEIRELRDAARYRPSRDKYKIYILDEAHQITDAAFNALLKTLEEPPDHIVFMMATTQPEDIPQTVRSRCQHFSFHAVKLVDILGQLRSIATQEDIDADDSALSLLAEAGDGSMRDALSIMDQAIASAPMHDGRATLDASQIRELMGTVPNAVFERILIAVDANQSAEVLTTANTLLDAGNSPSQLARQCVRYLRNCLIAKIAGVAPDASNLDGPAAELLQISPDEQRRAARSAALFSEEELTRFLQTMLRTFDELGYRQEQRFHFELGLLKLVHLRRLLPVEEVLSKFASPSTAKSPTRTPGSSGSASASPTASASVRTAAPVAPMQARPAVAAPAPPPPPDFATASKSAFTPLPHIPRSEPTVASDPISLTPAVASAPAPTPVAVTPTRAAAAPATTPETFSPFSANPFAKTTPSAVYEAPKPVPSAPTPKATEPIAVAAPATEPKSKPAPLAAAPEPSPAAEPRSTAPDSAPVDTRATSAPEPAPDTDSEFASLEAMGLSASSNDETEQEPYSPASVTQTAAEPAAPPTEAPKPVSTGLDPNDLQRIAVDALANARQASASDALADSEWTTTEGAVNIQTALSKIMLPTVVNPDAEKIFRTALVSAHPGLKITLVPASKTSSSTSPRKARPAASGSAQAKALDHPIVREAQRLFHAELRTVIDLTPND
jgi:DNA polymerase-3 subunit gamma/tau